nr:hypothetical protein [Caldilineaceae bacterium]
MKQLLILLAWLLVCIGGFACTQMQTQDSQSSPLAGEPASPLLAPDEGQLPQAGASLTTAMQIVAQRDLTLGGLRIVSLSPDGQWLLAYGREDLCVLASAMVSVPTCVKWLAPLGYNLAWSPDSRYVAVTENFEKYFWESDIWLFDVEEGTLQDLTDDGVSGTSRWVIEPPVTLPVDLLPTWSTDGKSLVFIRSMRVKDGTETWAGTDLVTMALPDQPIRKLVTVDNHEPAVVSTLAGLHWAQAGEALLFTYFGAYRGEKDGVWVFRPNENRLDHLLASDPEKGPPLLVQVAADGHTALIWYFLKALPYGGEPPPNVALMALFDLETGVVQDLVP